MRYRKFRIILSKGWSLVLYLLSVGILTVTGACKSQHKAVRKGKNVKVIENRYDRIMALYGVEPPSMRVDRKSEIRRLQTEIDSLQKILDHRKGVVIYGPPEMMERRSRENAQISHDIDSMKLSIRNLESEDK